MHRVIDWWRKFLKNKQPVFFFYSELWYVNLTISSVSARGRLFFCKQLDQVVRTDWRYSDRRYTPLRRGATPGTRYFMPTTSVLPLNVGFHFNTRTRVVDFLTTRYFDFHQTSTFHT